jgi:hypothetical protein
MVIGAKLRRITAVTVMAVRMRALAGPEKDVEKVQCWGADDQRRQEQNRHLNGRTEGLPQAMRGAHHRPIKGHEGNAGEQHRAHLLLQTDTVANLYEEVVAIAEDGFDNSQVFHKSWSPGLWIR